MHWTFANDIAICIFVHFVGRDGPTERRRPHLVACPASHYEGHEPLKLFRDKATLLIGTRQVVIDPAWKSL
jgi:hypothetical protein